jgi:cob(I)alamin adenosyltransferase
MTLSPSEEDEINRRHAEKMAKHKAAKDRMLAEKSADKGLLIVHTGSGKGKSTAAFGMVMRCIGHDMPVTIIQFTKGKWETGERVVLDRFPELVTCKAMGEGFTWETQDRARDIAAARAAWDAALAAMADPRNAMVVLDELNIVLRNGYLPIEAVIEALRTRNPALHVVVTGRNARPELIEIADMVTEMTLLMHPFQAGIKAQRGVEY